MDVETKLSIIAKQLETLQKMMIAIQQILVGKRNGGVVTKIMPFPVSDISTAQLVDAYKRGLSLEQLVVLGNNKYTAEMIAKKLTKYGEQIL